ncbi:MAG: EAL domain-containing protein [Sulfurimonas sp.]|jgi:diguanylate cyclase (GGDEF)-like protein
MQNIKSIFELLLRGKVSVKLFVTALILSIIWFVVAFTIISNRVNNLENEKYTEISNKMKNELKVLIEEKTEAVRIIALSVAQNRDIKESLINSKVLLNLNEFSLQLAEFTSLKNVWFQIITPDGKSFSRSWTNKVGDDLSNVRLDVAQMIKKPQVISSISVGKFDLTFKSMVPIYDNGKFIGIIEILGKFNSIALKMESKEYDMVMLVDKSYKKQLEYIKNESFLDEYYVVNQNVKKEFLELIHEKSVEYFIGMDTFLIDKKTNRLVVTYQLPDIHDQPMGHFIMFHDLDKINISDVIRSRDRLILTFTLIYLFIFAFVYYIYVKQYQGLIDKLNRELEEKVEEKTKELKNQSETLDHLAHHDSLTGLPNRLLFLDRLKQAIKHAKRRNKNVTILFLDLDRFKEVNDTFGHEIGDKLLREVASRLLNCVRDEDTIARLGGDEFTIILEDVGQNEVIKIAKNIIKAMQEPVYIRNQELYTTFSVGISSYPEDGNTSSVLIRNADTAMYKAKENGKNKYEFYNSKMTEVAFERLMMESGLRRAIDENEFLTYFQPKINAMNGKVIGSEALVRWQHPLLGLVPPMKFLSLAEDIGLIKYIDEWMMMNTLKTIKRFQDEGIHTGIVSLNISMKHLEDKQFMQYLQETIMNIGFDTSFLELEITESQIMKNPVSAIDTLKNIRSMGIRISIDDFGTGYSSLSYLKRLPINNLKIDREFIIDAYKDEEDASIVRAIIALAKSLNLSYIAEGVETKEQLDFLLEEGCHDIQGYYYSKPLPEDAFKEFLLKN